jgi:hypothetical protein
MTTLSETPAEIWQYILRCVIHVPIFLDPDGVAVSPVSSMSAYHIYGKKSAWNDEKLYWESERSRNACRRVCRVWDVYLGTIGHRFVRMLDVVHEVVPPTVLNQAIRISLAPYGRGAAQPVMAIVPHKFRWYYDAEQFLSLIPDTHAINVKIMTATYMHFETSHLTRIAARFPNLVTLVNVGLTSGLGVIVQHLPHLRHLYTSSYKRDPQSVTINCPKLETLSFRPENFDIEDFTPEKWSLPSLQTLRILGGDERSNKEAWQRMTTPLLTVIGSNLRALYIAPNYLPASFEEVLKACPKLEYLLVNTSGNSDMNPPASHPLHTIMVPFFSPWMARPTKPVPSWPGWPMVRTIVFDAPWEESRWGKELRRWHERWNNSSIVIEDSHGVKLSDWLKK